jgi:hypothetical protein
MRSFGILKTIAYAWGIDKPMDVAVLPGERKCSWAILGGLHHQYVRILTSGAHRSPQIDYVLSSDRSLPWARTEMLRRGRNTY